MSKRGEKSTFSSASGFCAIVRFKRLNPCASGKYDSNIAALLWVAYPLLRVEIEKIEVERVGGLPPSLLRPTSIEPLDLYIDGHLSSLWTAKAADLAKLTPQLAINALQQRGGAGDFTCYSL